MKNIFTLLLLVILVPGYLYSQTDEFGNSGGNKVLSGLGLSLSYVNVINGSNFDFDSSGTIECWIYPNSPFTASRTVISKGSNVNLSFLFGINTSSLLYLRIGNTDFVNTGGQSIPINTWTHIAVLWNGKPNYTVKFYINGVISGSPVTLNATWITNNDQLRIGVSQAFPNQSFTGYIDEVKFYKKDISISDILSNRFCGLGDYYVGAPIDINTSYTYKNLFSSWTFNQSGGTAFDYISSNSGFYTGSAVNTGPIYGNPVPYNFALKFGGGSNDYITIPSNTVFDQTSDGTFEFWFKPSTISQEQILISKAASSSNISFIVGLNASGKLYMAIGNYLALNSSGSSLDINKWNHVAITWITSGNNYSINFYKNGKMNGTASSILKAYSVNSSPILIGNSLFQNTPANGFLDELRLWNNALTQTQILSYMFVSSKSITNSDLLAAYNFDGSLQNFSSAMSSTGSFNNNNNINYSRFSAYSNDSLPGAYGNLFISHSTTINRGNQPNTFPSNYLLSNPFLTIPDNNLTGISDSINYTGAFGYISGVELFLAIDHTYVGDLIISLTAPNGTTKNVIQNNAGSGKNILSFFGDSFSENVTSTTYLPPWGFIKPFQLFGNFSASSAQGYWKLKCVDNAGSDIGVLKGWGLKFDVITSVNNQSELPKNYRIYQNYPNPYNSYTVIKYEIPKESFVSIKIFDVNGKVVKEIANKLHKAGYYEVVYNAESLSSGIYYYKIVSNNYNKTMKMVLLK